MNAEPDEDEWLVTVQLLHEAAVFDFFQARSIDKILRLQTLGFRPGLGEMINYGLNAGCGRIGYRRYESLSIVVVSIVHQRYIAHARVFLEGIERKFLLRLERVNRFDVCSHKSHDDLAPVANVAFPC